MVLGEHNIWGYGGWWLRESVSDAEVGVAFGELTRVRVAGPGVERRKGG